MKRSTSSSIFVSSFYSPKHPIAKKFHEILQNTNLIICLCQYLTIRDIIIWSGTNKYFNEMKLSNKILQEYFYYDNLLLRRFGKFQVTLVLTEDYALGIIRRILYQLMKTEMIKAELSIDSLTGHIQLDIGNAFASCKPSLLSSPRNNPKTSKSKKSFSFEEIKVIEDEDDDKNIHRIEKFLEASSVDEFDDFKPRHPQPREAKGHRRGDSYFNSDIESITTDAIRHFDLNDLAKLALDEESSYNELGK